MCGQYREYFLQGAEPEPRWRGSSVGKAEVAFQRKGNAENLSHTTEMRRYLPICSFGGRLVSDL